VVFVKTSDLSDSRVLAVVTALNEERGYPADRWSVAARCADVPEKIVYAKLKRLHKRGLLTGCPCGCRGDYERA
jgi:hypothetical protein